MAYIDSIKYKGQSLLMADNARKANKKLRPDGYIYILQFGSENIYKIGVSCKPKRRITDLDASSHKPLKTISVLWFKNVYEMEECIHENMNEYLLRKEWFKIPSNVIKGIIQHLNEFSEKGIYLKRL